MLAECALTCLTCGNKVWAVVMATVGRRHWEFNARQ